MTHKSILSKSLFVEEMMRFIQQSLRSVLKLQFCKGFYYLFEKESNADTDFIEPEELKKMKAVDRRRSKYFKNKIELAIDRTKPRRRNIR